MYGNVRLFMWALEIGSYVGPHSCAANRLTHLAAPATPVLSALLLLHCDYKMLWRILWSLLLVVLNDFSVGVLFVYCMPRETFAILLLSKLCVLMFHLSAFFLMDS